MIHVNSISESIQGINSKGATSKTLCLKNRQSTWNHRCSYCLRLIRRFMFNNCMNRTRYISIGGQKPN